jgi:hypothetical protein
MTGDFSASGSVMSAVGQAMMFGAGMAMPKPDGSVELIPDFMTQPSEADVALFDARLRGVPTQGDVIAAHLRVAAGIRRRARTAACRQRPRSLGGRP